MGATVQLTFWDREMRALEEGDCISSLACYVDEVKVSQNKMRRSIFARLDALQKEIEAIKKEKNQGFVCENQLPV